MSRCESSEPLTPALSPGYRGEGVSLTDQSCRYSLRGLSPPTKGTDMVTRTLGLALMLAVVPASALAQSGRADVENAFPTFGVSLTGPSGWVHLPGGSAGVITRWGKVNPQTGEVVAAVMVEVELIDAEVGNQYAKRLAQRIAGTV